MSIKSTDTYSVYRQLGDERCTAIASSGPHSCRMTSLSRRALTPQDCCPSFTSTDQRIHTSSVLFVAAERGWSMMYAAILVDNFKFCESNRRRDSSDDLAATGVPWHYQCWHSGELHLEHSLGRWDGGGSAGRLPRNPWIVALQTVGWVVFQIQFEHTYMHTYHHNEIFHFIFIRNPCM